MKTNFPDNTPAEFGDHVRIRNAPETDALGLAGLEGQVFGQTTPSVSGVKVIGVVNQDYAINVYFKGKEFSHWFAPELIELLDHAPGTEISVTGVPDSRMIRAADGQWIKVSEPRPWWKFWK